MYQSQYRNDNNNSNNNSPASNNSSNYNQQQQQSTLRVQDSPLRAVPVFRCVRIRVGMKVICTDMHTLQQCPTSVLAQLFSPPFPLYDDLEEIHRYPHEYVSEESFLSIVDCLRCGEWAPIRTTQLQEELVRAVAVLGPLHTLPDVPRALDATLLVMEGGTDRFHQMSAPTEDIKVLRQRMKDAAVRMEQYASRSRDLVKLEAALAKEDEALLKASNMAQTYRDAADSAKRSAEAFTKDLAAADEQLAAQEKTVAELTAALEPLAAETDSLTRAARKAKLAAATQRELSEVAEAAAKAAEKPQPNGADPIKDQTMEDAAQRARDVFAEHKEKADVKSAAAASAKEKSDVAQAALATAQQGLDELKQAREALSAKVGSAAGHLEESEKIAKQFEDALVPVTKQRNAAATARDEMKAKVVEVAPEQKPTKVPRKKIVKRPKPKKSKTKEEIKTARAAKKARRDRLYRFYEAYCPEKLPYVDMDLAAITCTDEELYDGLAVQYGPEPAAPAAAISAAATAPGASDAGVDSAAEEPHATEEELAHLFGNEKVEYTDVETDEEEAEEEPEVHPLSVCPHGAPRIIPSAVRSLGRRGYRIVGEIRGDIDIDPPPPPVRENSNNMMTMMMMGGATGAALAAGGGAFGGGGAGGRGGGGLVGGFGGARRGGGIGRPGGGFAPPTMASVSRRTGSEDRSQSNARGGSEVNSTVGGGTGGGGPGPVQPFRPSNNASFCDTTTVIFEKQLERLDRLQMLAFEAPSGDFFRQKKPTGWLQEVIDAGSFA